MEPLIFWLLLASSFLLLELGHPGLFFFLSFFFGSLAGAAATFLGYCAVWQYSIALSVTIISIFALYRLKKYIEPHREYRTNVYALRGKKALVTVPIKPFTVGQIKIDGQIWSAKSINHETCQINNMVEIVEITGCHAIVRNINN